MSGRLACACLIQAQIEDDDNHSCPPAPLRKGFVSMLSAEKLPEDIDMHSLAAGPQTWMWPSKYLQPLFRYPTGER